MSRKHQLEQAHATAHQLKEQLEEILIEDFPDGEIQPDDEKCMTALLDVIDAIEMQQREEREAAQTDHYEKQEDERRLARGES